MTRTWAEARSLLVVTPGEPGALEASLACGADVVVVELTRANPSSAAHRATRAWLERNSSLAGRPLLAVQVERPCCEADLAAVMPGRPDAIVLAGCRAPADVEQLGARLAVHEAELGLADGSTRIIASVGDSAGVASLFAAPGYGGVGGRIVGLTWSAVRLAADLGIEPPPSAPGAATSPLDLVRGMTPVAARAARITAIDSEEAPGSAAFVELCRRSRQTGYSAKLTRRAAEVAIINAAFAKP